MADCSAPVGSASCPGVAATCPAVRALRRRRIRCRSVRRLLPHRPRSGPSRSGPARCPGTAIRMDADRPDGGTCDDDCASGGGDGAGAVGAAPAPARRACMTKRLRRPRWQGGTRIVASHANGAQMATDMPSRYPETKRGKATSPLPVGRFRRGFASCTAMCIAMSAACARHRAHVARACAPLAAVIPAASSGMADASGEPVPCAPAMSGSS